MRAKYDFSNATKNPYVKKLKKAISIRIDDDVIAYFKKVAENVGVSYQGLMSLYLRAHLEISLLGKILRDQVEAGTEKRPIRSK